MLRPLLLASLFSLFCVFRLTINYSSKDMPRHIITQYHECGIFRIVKMYICCGIYIHISMSGCGRPGSCVLILRSGPLALWPISVHFEISVIFESQDPGILNQDHRIATRTAGTRHPPAIPTARITHKALQSNFLPLPYTPPVKFFYIRRTSQVFPIMRSSQLRSTWNQITTFAPNFHSRLKTQIVIR